MDSNSFLMGSLDQLAHRLFADGHHMSILKASRLCQDIFGEFSLQKFNLLTRKGNVARFHIILFLINAGVFPYEFLTSRSVLKETKLPPIESFSSSLGVGRIISPEDYIHAQMFGKLLNARLFKIM